jgi:hypothetical protein
MPGATSFLTLVVVRECRCFPKPARILYGPSLDERAQIRQTGTHVANSHRATLVGGMLPKNSFTVPLATLNLVVA